VRIRLTSDFPFEMLQNHAFKTPKEYEVEPKLYSRSNQPSAMQGNFVKQKMIPGC
jgi:hypothetical protein